jgi:hypothetical protein
VNVIEIAGARALVLDTADGPIADAMGLVSWLGDVMGEDARALVVPTEVMPGSFFDLPRGWPARYCRRRLTIASSSRWWAM